MATNTHCRRGHELAVVGTTQRGKCKECVREDSRRWRRDNADRATAYSKARWRAKYQRPRALTILHAVSHDTPPAMLREALTRMRAAGIDFAVAWEPAVDYAVGGDRSWREALEGTRAVWQAAYERQAVTDMSLLSTAA